MQSYFERNWQEYKMFRNTIKMASESKVASALEQVLERMRGAVARRPETTGSVNPRLVAVSKTKPVSMIVEAYVKGQRHFGENYLNELVEKSKDDEILELCKEIQWHYIGTMQSKKASKFCQIPRLFMIETINSVKLANNLNAAWVRANKEEKLKVLVQVNTSGEDSKSGCTPGEVTSLVKHIKENCPSIDVCGLMTIGSFDHDLSTGPNPDFLSLIKSREEVCQALGINIEDFELSMGMSADFEHAIELGSTNIRVGSTIFGARPPPKPKVTESAASSSKASETPEQSSAQPKSNSTEPQSTSDTNLSSCNDVAEATENVNKLNLS